ncbi:MAG: glutamate synthase [Chloroflexi bacterium]|nr:glutamate synthase [Chloroflexota bacterium]
MAVIDCEGMATREINRAIRRLALEGEREIRLTNPGARHNLGVALDIPTRLIFEGPVGYYCASMIDGPEVHIRGNAGWAIAENMMAGTVAVEGSASMGAAATIRGGTVFVRGNVGARSGISMKGGMLVVGGSCGYMTGFMMQKGTIIICGDTGPGLGDSMYEGQIFVGGQIGDLGNDAVVKEPADEDRQMLRETLAAFGVGGTFDFKKVVSGRRLWNFSKKEIGIWIEAL